MKRLLSTILLAGSLAPLMGLEIWPVGLDKVGNSPNMEWSDSDGMTLKVMNSDEGKQVMNVLKLKAEDVAGKTFKVSFEYKMDVEPGENKWSGAKAFFQMKSGAKYARLWCPLPCIGTKDWTARSVTLTFPEEVSAPGLYLGIENTKGTVSFRKFKMEEK